MRTETRNRIYTEIVRGVAKKASSLVVDDETSRTWDEVAIEVASMRGKWYTFAIPDDVGSPFEDLGITSEQILQYQHEFAARSRQRAAGTAQATGYTPGAGDAAGLPMDLRDICRAVQSGQRTVEDVAEEFRTRRWPDRTAPVLSTAEAGHQAEQRDREPDPPGSFFEVAAAYYDEIITIEQYAILAKAASDAIQEARER